MDSSIKVSIKNGMRIHHVTLATGNSVLHHLDTVDYAAITAVLDLLPDGGDIPMSPGFRVVCVMPIFTIYYHGNPIVTCGIGCCNDETWNRLVELQEQFADVIAKTPKGYYLGVTILPALVLVPPDQLAWLADFERVLTAAFLLDEGDGSSGS